MKKYTVAIVGATGLVGQMFLKVLAARKLPVKEYIMYASGRSAGTKITFAKKEWLVLELKEENIKGKKIDFALFGVEGDLARTFVPVFTAAGARVIDNSSAFRMEQDVPLVVPEVNIDAVLPRHNIIANPNCSTIQAVVALAPLHKAFDIKRIVFSTYQAVSGAGQQGIADLENGAKGEPPQKFIHAIYNNVLPHIDAFMADGYTKEEHKMIDETRKILRAPKLKITATTVRVPVQNGHSESINIEFKNPCTLEQIRSVLRDAPGIVLIDNAAKNHYPMPITASGRDEVFVGRVRKDESVKSGVNLWVVADNLRKGAASNAVQILEKLLK